MPTNDVMSCLVQLQALIVVDVPKPRTRENLVDSQTKLWSRLPHLLPLQEATLGKAQELHLQPDDKIKTDKIVANAPSTL